MEDGLDIYCINCNNAKREEKRGKRHVPGVIVDKFVQFKEMYDNDEYNESRTREVQKRIELALVEAKGRFKRELPVDPEEVCRRIFLGGKYVCNVTNKPLTPKCFLDHHSITFEVRTNASNKKVMDVICSDCKVQVFNETEKKPSSVPLPPGPLDHEARFPDLFASAP